MNIEILGIPVYKNGRENALLQCIAWLTATKRKFHHIATVNPEFVMRAKKDDAFLGILRQTDINMPDGIGLLFASWFLYGGKGTLSRITGVELTWKLAEMCAMNGRSMYLIGAEKGIAEKAANALRKKFSELKIVGAEEGIKKSEFHKLKEVEEDKQLCERIRESRPDVLLVAFGAPKQELWITSHKNDFPSIRIAVGIGGTFDYISGIIAYAPALIRAAGLEWLYRLIIQPLRIKRIFTAVIEFSFAILNEKFKTIFIYR